MRLAMILAAALAFATQAEAAEPMTAVTQLGWLRIGEYAPIMVADAKGYFTDEGIAHRIADGGPGKNPIPIVAVGQAQFGLITSGMNLIAARTARDPVDIVAVGTLFQSSPSSYFKLANPSDPPATPKDMEGHSAGMTAESEYLLRVLARKNGLDISKIRMVHVGANAEPLMVGQVDFFNGWIVNQTYQVEQEAAKPDAPPNLKGKTWRAVVMADWGMPSYADVIVASGKTVRENPELVRHYVRAVARGMQFILDHPDEAVDVVAKYPGQIEDAKKLAWRFKLQNPLTVSADTAAHGLLWMSPAIWQSMGDALKESEQVPFVPPVPEMMTDQFIAGPGAK